jgi:tRNA pseudouridine13 synthase
MIKARPEDFIVEERSDLPLRGRGEYRVYKLTKSDWNTLDLIHFLSRSAALPLSCFSYGGKKDKHGLTHQFIAIRSPRDFSRKGKNFTVRSIGFMDRPMGPDLIKGNAFTVAIRNLDHPELIEDNAGTIMKTGFPNFFDDQRFRSYDPERGFFAEKIIRRHWNGALQVFLTSVRDDDSKRERGRRQALFDSWQDWPACLALALGPFEKNVFGYLNAHPKNLVAALHLIPQEEVSMLFAAFQSHLWNETLRRLIRLKADIVKEIIGKEGVYLFWQNLDERTLDDLKNAEIPTAAAKMNFPDNLVRSIYEQILREIDLRLGSFRTKALRKVRFRSFGRKALVIPGDFRVLGRDEDELHAGKKKLTISFFLPRGSYATMLIKRLSLAWRL